MYFLVDQNASCAVVIAGPVAAVQGGHHHAAVAGMDELTAADVDAHMAEAGVEEHQIPGLQLPPGDGLAGVILGCAAVLRL